MRQLVAMASVAILGCGAPADERRPEPVQVQVPDAPPPATLFTKAIAVPAEAAAVRFGMAEAEAVKALGASKISSGATYALEAQDGVVVAIAADSAEPLDEQLAKLWGRPRFERAGEQVWLDPAGKLSASLARSGKRVTFAPIAPIATVLGGPGFELPFVAKRSLLGATIDELGTAWRGRFCVSGQLAAIKDAGPRSSIWTIDAPAQGEPDDSVALCLPYALPGGDRHARAHFGPDKRVREVSLTFRAVSPAERSEIASAIEAKLGKYVEVANRRVHLDPRARMRAVVTFADTAITLAIGPYLPLAELVGPPGMKLAIETKSMLTGTREEIRGENPRSYVPDAMLALPPTEFCDRNTDVGFVELDRKAFSYMVGLRCPESKLLTDMMLGLLEKKFGRVKPTDASTWTYHHPFRETTVQRTAGGWLISVNRCARTDCSPPPP